MIALVPRFIWSPRRVVRANVRLRDLGRVLLFVAAGLFITVRAPAATFAVEPIPPAPTRIGAGLSIAVDAGGNPHLAYGRDIDVNGSFRHAYKQGGVWHFISIVDSAAGHSSLGFSNGTLYCSYQNVPLADCMFATFDGASWATELVSDLFPVEGLYTSLAFDQFGSPHIAYQEGSGADNAIHAFRFGGGWIPNNADGFGTSDEEGRYTSIALSAEDTIFISHIGRGAGGQFRPRLSEFAGAGWETIDIDPGLSGIGATAVAVTALGRPLVAFVASGGGGASGTLYYATRLTPSTWAITPIDTLGGFSDLEMKLDGLGQPHIAYRKAGALRHAYLDAIDGWRRETVDAPTLGVGDELDLAIDGSNILHIGYLDRLQYPSAQITPVKYAHGTFGSWTVEAVEGQEDEGRYLALTTTDSGEPVVAFYDATVGDVQVGRRVDFNSWLADDVAEAGNVGRFVSLPPRTVGVNAADVAYFDATTGTVVRRSGTYDAWNQTTVVATVPALASLSYADSAGFGRIAYYDSLAGDVYLARLGPSGTSIVPVDQVGDVGRSCNVRVTADGVTHIIYHDASSGRLRHARFEAGAWAYLDVATGPGVGRTSALCSRWNALGACYYDAVNGDLHWALWDGAAWTTGLIAANGDVGSACAVAMEVGGDIDISYYDATNQDVRYARVSYAGVVVDSALVDGAGDVGRANAIAISPATGLAQVAYYSASTGQMLFAVKQPAPGTGVSDYPGPPKRSEISLSPNPARVRDVIRVAYVLPGRTVGSVGIYDVAGRELTVRDAVALGGTADPVELRVPSGASGIVFVRVMLESGESSSAKMVVLR